MYRNNYIVSLQSEIAEMVAEHFTPTALRYGYAEMPLETHIRWRPMVLIIGNYSSGKSSLINEFLGAKIQDTGQAPTDDSFTVLTWDDSVPPEKGIQVTEERDGKALLNDPEFPFSTLKKQGQRFAAHFRLKKINSPFLRDLAIVDTPGMLDSITERDRGYDYQEVIADLAQKAGLVLVLFDAHKAGTVREAYKSIRETLAAATFEDRIIFVLNRIDECSSFSDLLRVYGTLCWNLSQITGRKDIPMIRLTYSPNAARTAGTAGPEYLPLLENQREELRQAVLQTPLRRLDHLATFVEVHGERMCHYLEALLSFRREQRTCRFRRLFTGLLTGILAGCLTIFSLMVLGLGMPPEIMAGLMAGVTGISMMFWMTLIQGRLERSFRRKRMENMDTLTPLDDQTRKDSWTAIRESLARHLEKADIPDYSLHELRKDFHTMCKTCSQASQEIREALSELAEIPEDEEDETDQHSEPESDSDRR
ncbi:MAG: dynamin family protein [Desulfobacterales bacterium]